MVVIGFRFRRKRSFVASIISKIVKIVKIVKSPVDSNFLQTLLRSCPCGLRRGGSAAGPGLTVSCASPLSPFQSATHGHGRAERRCSN